MITPKIFLKILENLFPQIYSSSSSEGRNNFKYQSELNSQIFMFVIGVWNAWELGIQVNLEGWPILAKLTSHLFHWMNLRLLKTRSGILHSRHHLKLEGTRSWYALRRQHSAIRWSLLWRVCICMLNICICRTLGGIILKLEGPWQHLILVRQWLKQSSYHSCMNGQRYLEDNE